MVLVLILNKISSGFIVLARSFSVMRMRMHYTMKVGL